MHIAFDATPLVAERKTGIGYCEENQIKYMLAEKYRDIYELQYFSGKESDKKRERLRDLKKANVVINDFNFPGRIYRGLQNFISVPYSYFFGKYADVTHFFNYIIPPKVETATVVTVHDMVYKEFPETMNFRTRELLNISLEKSLNRADIIVTDSIFSKKEVIKYFPKVKEKIRVVYCGVDFEKFNNNVKAIDIAEVKVKYKIHGSYLLYLGTLEPRKNILKLIESYDLFCKKQKKNTPYLVIAGGKGWLFDDIFKETRKRGLENNIIFTGYLPEREVKPIICGATAFLFPSIYEGFGLPPLEAMACGTPVLVSNKASLPEVVGDAGIIVDPTDAEEIAYGMEILVNESQVRAEMRERGLKRSKKFTWTESAKQLHNIYREAVQMHREQKNG